MKEISLEPERLPAIVHSRFLGHSQFRTANGIKTVQVPAPTYPNVPTSMYPVNAINSVAGYKKDYNLAGFLEI